MSRAGRYLLLLMAACHPAALPTSDGQSTPAAPVDYRQRIDPVTLARGGPVKLELQLAGVGLNPPQTPALLITLKREPCRALGPETVASLNGVPFDLIDPGLAENDSSAALAGLPDSQLACSPPQFGLWRLPRSLEKAEIAIGDSSGWIDATFRGIVSWPKLTIVSPQGDLHPGDEVTLRWDPPAVHGGAVQFFDATQRQIFAVVQHPYPFRQTMTFVVPPVNEPGPIAGVLRVQNVLSAVTVEKCVGAVSCRESRDYGPDLGVARGRAAGEVPARLVPRGSR